MQVGTALSILAQPGRPDVALFNEHMALGDLAEPLGFQSAVRAGASLHRLFDVASAPATAELLCRAHETRHPGNLRHRPALARSHSGGGTDRAAGCHQRRPHADGIGRGAATAEYEGFRIPMEEARPRFVESAQLIIKALATIVRMGRRILQIPRISIRPRPISHPERRFYASSVSPEFGRGDGEARVRPVDRDAERVAEGGRGCAPVSRDGAKRRSHAPAADHPDQRRLRADPRRSPRMGPAIPQRKMGFHRYPLPFLGRTSGRGQGLRVPTASSRRPIPR